MPQTQIDPIVQRRLEVLEQLIDEEYDSSPKVFENRTGIKMAQVSQWFTGYRALRDKALRRLEEKTGKPEGWFDRLRTAELASGLTLNEPGLQVRTRTDELEILQYEAGGSMGAGVILRDQPGVIQSWRVTPEWVQKNVHNITNPKNLAIVTGFGDSMRPMYNPGDPLLVDIGVKKVEFDGIYFFRIDDEGFIKRLQRVPGEGLVAISENKAYRDWVIREGMDFEVFARVVKVWRGEDF